MIGLAEREQGRPLLRDQEGGELPGHAVLALVGERVPPRLGLRIQVREVPEGPPGPEVRPEVLDRIFYAPLLQSRQLQPVPLIHR
jgi:hypothetical protein